MTEKPTSLATSKLDLLAAAQECFNGSIGKGIIDTNTGKPLKVVYSPEDQVQCAAGSIGLAEKRRIAFAANEPAAEAPMGQDEMATMVGLAKKAFSPSADNKPAHPSLAGNKRPSRQLHDR
ncbi:MAG: hypothetical protein V4735_09870 [Pseudomonadota bacterium]